MFVGNLPFTATEDELSSLFQSVGTVQNVSIVNDRETGRSRGFGFVEMADDDADKAIAALNGKEFKGRSLTVSEAKPFVKRDGGGGGGGRGGYR